jgi:hypothetical protein
MNSENDMIFEPPLNEEELAKRALENAREDLLGFEVESPRFENAVTDIGGSSAMTLMYTEFQQLAEPKPIDIFEDGTTREWDTPIHRHHSGHCQDDPVYLAEIEKLKDSEKPKLQFEPGKIYRTFDVASKDCETSKFVYIDICSGRILAVQAYEPMDVGELKKLMKWFYFKYTYKTRRERMWAKQRVKNASKPSSDYRRLKESE